jgi:hypothetical protein
MLNGFSKNRQFNGFPKKGFGNGSAQWNGIPCAFWLDAGQAVDNPANLGRVGAWIDVISGTRWIQTVVASQPQYLTSDSAFNNRPVINNDTGGRHFNNIESQSILRTGRENFFAIVVQATAANGRGIVLTQGTLNGEFNLGGINSGASKMGIYNGGTGVFTTTTDYDLNPHIFVISDKKILLDGVFETVTGAQSTQLLSFASFNRIFGNSGGVGFVGKLAEILCFPFDPTDTEMLSVSDLLNAKYAIY